MFLSPQVCVALAVSPTLSGSPGTHTEALAQREKKKKVLRTRFLVVICHDMKTTTTAASEVSQEPTTKRMVSGEKAARALKLYFALATYVCDVRLVLFFLPFPPGHLTPFQRGSENVRERITHLPYLPSRYFGLVV